MMNKNVSLARRVLFGDWNGIQFLLFPTTIFLWLDSFSFLFWMYNLLANQIYQLPITLFFITGFFIFFLIIKYSSFLNEENNPKHNVRDMRRFIIELHHGLLMVLLIGMIVFVLKTFLAYFYQIELPIKRIYSHIFQFIGVAIAFFYYIQSLWTKPFLKKDVSYPRAINQVLIYARNNVAQTLIYTFQIILVTILTSYAYYLLISHLLTPGINLLETFSGIRLRIELIKVHGAFDLLIDIFLMFAAFLISNIVFYPVMRFSAKFLERLHPINKRTETNAPTQSQA